MHRSQQCEEVGFAECCLDFDEVTIRTGARSFAYTIRIDNVVDGAGVVVVASCSRIRANTQVTRITRTVVIGIGEGTGA